MSPNTLRSIIRQMVQSSEWLSRMLFPCLNYWQNNYSTSNRFCQAFQSHAILSERLFNLYWYRELENWISVCRLNWTLSWSNWKITDESRKDCLSEKVDTNINFSGSTFLSKKVDTNINFSETRKGTSGTVADGDCYGNKIDGYGEVITRKVCRGIRGQMLI